MLEEFERKRASVEIEGDGRVLNNSSIGRASHWVHTVGVPSKTTNQELLEALATRPLPSPFDAHIDAMRGLSRELRAAAHAVGIKRKFTLDGRLLGDLGEVIARLHFGIDLHEQQQDGQDGRCEITGKTVELKLRSAANLVYVKKVPDILVVVYLSPVSLRWGIVCNGPGPALMADAKWHEGESRFSTNLQRLRRAQESLPKGSLCLVDRATPLVATLA